MAGVVLGTPYLPVEVDLWGQAFKTVPATRSVGKKVEGFQEQVEAATDSDQVVAAVGNILDVRIKPVEGTRKASTVIKEKWKADELTLDQLLAFLGDLEEADRPT